MLVVKGAEDGFDAVDFHGLVGLGGTSLRPKIPIQRSILDRLPDMLPKDVLGPGEVRDGARDL